MPFKQWNHLLLNHFFRSDMSGRRVRLFVTPNLINEIGHRNDLGGMNDFITAVNEGPEDVDGITLDEKACSLNTQFARLGRAGEADYQPTFMPYLCLCALAARWEDGQAFGANAYYERLHHLRGNPPDRIGTPQMGGLFGLSKVLEFWSQRLRRGELGVFTTAIRRGRQRYVSLWRAQVLLTQQQRDRLPAVFYELALDPSDPPPAGEITQLLQQCPSAQEVLGNLLAQDALRDDTVEDCLDELGNWDGRYVPTVDGHQRETASRNLRLLMTTGQRLPRLQFVLALPDEELPEELEFRADNLQVTCGRKPSGVYGPLTRENGEKLDASKYLSEGLMLATKANVGRAKVSIRASFRARGLYLFWWDTALGWIQHQQPSWTGGLGLLMVDEAAREVLRWADRHHVELSQPVQGLPPGWSFFKLSPAAVRAEAREEFPGGRLVPFPATLYHFLRACRFRYAA